MSNLTADQIKLQAYIEDANARLSEACEAWGIVAWVTTVSEPSHWAERGVYTVAQYERYCLEQTVRDMYKEVHGIRPRHLGIDSMSDAELMAEYEVLLNHPKID